MRIDWWTLALQTVNVLILIWILGRFFFRPVADIVARRQEEANRLLSDADAARRAAAEAREDAGK
jgi:F-type H+-transporting ATPase subunit b